MSSSPKTFLVCHGAWSAGWVWKKMHPLMSNAGHRLMTPSYTGLGERTHLAHPGIDLETHVADMLNVITYEDLRDFVLIGHSYGGMVATGVADRARDKVKQLIYVDAFVPADGQSLFDLNEVARAPMQEAAKGGDGWRVPPNPTPPDTLPEDVAWLTDRRVHMPIKCFEQKLKLSAPLTLPRSYIYATRITPADTFGPFREDDEERSGVALRRDRRQPLAERHRAGSVDGAAGENRGVTARVTAFVPRIAPHKGGLPIRGLRRERWLTDARMSAPARSARAGLSVGDAIVVLPVAGPIDAWDPIAAPPGIRGAALVAGAVSLQAGILCGVRRFCKRQECAGQTNQRSRRQN